MPRSFQLPCTSAAFALTIFVVGSILSTNLCNAQEFELKDGERIVFVGSEFVEQQIKHNFLEADLTMLWPDRKITFRNLGWAGDTPSSIARGYFKGAAEGRRRLLEELDRLKPTVIFVCYGANTDPVEFESELAGLIKDLKQKSDRIVLVSHPPAESKLSTGRRQFADVGLANETRLKNSLTMKKLARESSSGQIRFVDLFVSAQDNWQRTKESGVLPASFERTFDTIRYREGTYLSFAGMIINQLGLTRASGGYDAKKEKALRDLIRDKNDLYFHQYRPQNETYLRGFRKHEQGQNAKEIAEFDALIEQAEARIHAFANGQPLPEPVAEPDPIKLSFVAATPEEEKATFKLAEGLNVSLFAAEPMVTNPIHMNFDSKGRLWVATSPIYPHIKPGAKPSDQIVILEDTDHDGRADKKTVFADDLLIPTGGASWTKKAVLTSPTRPSCCTSATSTMTGSLTLGEWCSPGSAPRIHITFFIRFDGGPMQRFTLISQFTFIVTWKLRLA